MTMYLANIHPNGRPHYVIRETCAQGGHLLCRDLFDLGPHPDRYIRYPGGNAFYVNEDEREQLFLAMEKQLRAFELKRYVFQVFDLQKEICTFFGRSVPQWIDARRLDDQFEEVLHRRHEDSP